MFHIAATYYSGNWFHCILVHMYNCSHSSDQDRSLHSHKDHSDTHQCLKYKCLNFWIVIKVMQIHVVIGVYGPTISSWTNLIYNIPFSSCSQYILCVLWTTLYSNLWMCHGIAHAIVVDLYMEQFQQKAITLKQGYHNESGSSMFIPSFQS